MLELGMPTLIEMPEMEDCAALCSELGLQFVELNMNLPQYQASRLDIPDLARISRQHAIYYTVHLDENLNVSDFNPHVSQAYFRTVQETIETAKRLNIPVLNMHLSRGVYFTLPNEKIFLFDQYRDQYLQSIQLFRRECEKNIGVSDLKICIENSSGFTSFQLQALDILLESPVFGLTFDIGHDHCVDHVDEPIMVSHKDRLHHFHFHDAVGKQNHLPLGSGRVDVQKYLNLACQTNSRIVLETKTVKGLKESVDWMRRHNL